MKQHEEGNKFDLMKYRMESAKSDLKSAKLLIEAEEYRAANNRSYYAIFHAISAIHAQVHLNNDGIMYKENNAYVFCMYAIEFNQNRFSAKLRYAEPVNPIETL